MQNLTLEEGKNIESLNPDLFFLISELVLFYGLCKWLVRWFTLIYFLGGLLQVESASLPVATFAKFQPHSPEFLEMTNPKAVLEARLRNFACLSKGDVIAIMYNNKIYELSVLETKPSDAVSVIGK